MTTLKQRFIKAVKNAELVPVQKLAFLKSRTFNLLINKELIFTKWRVSAA